MKVGLHKARQCFGAIFGRLPHSFSLPTPAISRPYHSFCRKQHGLCVWFTINPFLSAERARYYKMNSGCLAEHARYHKINSYCLAEHARYHKINSFCLAEHARYRKINSVCLAERARYHKMKSVCSTEHARYYKMNSVCLAEHARHSSYNFIRAFRITYRCLLLPNQASQEYLAKLDYEYTIT